MSSLEINVTGKLASQCERVFDHDCLSVGAVCSSVSSKIIEWCDDEKKIFTSKEECKEVSKQRQSQSCSK